MKYTWEKRTAASLRVGDYVRTLGPDEPGEMVTKVHSDHFSVVAGSTTFTNPDAEEWALRLDDEALCMMLKYLSDQTLRLTLLGEAQLPRVRRCMGQHAHTQLFHTVALLRSSFMSGGTNVVSGFIYGDEMSLPDDAVDWRCRVSRADHRAVATWYDELQAELKRPLGVKETPEPQDRSDPS